MSSSAFSKALILKLKRPLPPVLQGFPGELIWKIQWRNLLLLASAIERVPIFRSNIVVPSLKILQRRYNNRPHLPCPDEVSQKGSILYLERKQKDHETFFQYLVFCH